MNIADTTQPGQSASAQRPRASLAPDATCCYYSKTAPCFEATQLRCFLCGVPACYRHLDYHVALCELAS